MTISLLEQIADVAAKVRVEQRAFFAAASGTPERGRAAPIEGARAPARRAARATRARWRGIRAAAARRPLRPSGPAEREQGTMEPQTITRWGRSRPSAPAVHLPRGVFPADLTNADWRTSNGLPVVEHQRALVPSVPVHLRPAGELAGYHILWEPVWETHRPPPPVDPFLLKHVEGHIYTVVAQWDLTPLERQILDGHIG